MSNKTQFNRKAVVGIVCLAAVLVLIACPNPEVVSNDEISVEELTDIVLSEDFIWVDVKNGPQDIRFEKLEEAIAYTKEIAVDGSEFTIRVGGDRTLPHQVFDYEGKRVAITLISNDQTEKRVQAAMTGTFLEIAESVCLILDHGITLVDPDFYYFVRHTSLYILGTVVMKEGSSIVKDKQINTGWTGISNAGNLILSGGMIKGSESGLEDTGIVTSGTVIMESGNILNCHNPFGFGGGIRINAGTFTMYGGRIAQCTADEGGGVHIAGSGTFVINGGEITENWGRLGGGISAYGTTGNLTINGGTIAGNTAAAGSAVYHDSSGGKFTHNGGTLEGNDGLSNSVVWIYRGTFEKKGGIIISLSDNEYAVITETPGITMYRTNTAGPDVRLSFDPYGSPVAEGEWDNFNTYTITFVPAGGNWDDATTTNKNKTVTTDISYIITPPVLKHERAMLVGWYTSQIGGVEFDFTKPVRQNITVYARWNFDLPLTCVDDVRFYLASNQENQTPMGVYLPLQIDMGDINQPTSNWWKILESINQVVAWPKGVDLDLSACTMIGTHFAPGNYPSTAYYSDLPTNSFYYARCWECIYSITLPDVVTSMAATWYKGGMLSSAQLKSFKAKRLMAIPARSFCGWLSNSSSCTSIEYISIPAVIEIGQYAWTDCKNLKMIVLGNKPPVLELSGSEIHNTHPDLEIRVPTASIEAYKSTVDWRGVADRIIGY